MDKRLLLVLLCLQMFLLITASETETSEDPPVEKKANPHANTSRTPNNRRNARKRLPQSKQQTPTSKSPPLFSQVNKGSIDAFSPLSACHMEKR
ncbi:hypothetical protein AMECASPLE_022272 [Ameca splendens]|uniref:Uncharacterized protein n=1 Tax=Ameca splendens TaxID=208324 RepID=A0ABV1AA37_9TELE